MPRATAAATLLSSWRSAQRPAGGRARHPGGTDALGALTLRAVARRAGVSHAAPYRHFPNHEALLVELALEGFAELRAVHRRGGKVGGPGIRPHRQYRRRLYALCRQAPGGGAADVRPAIAQPRQVSRRWARPPTPSAPKSARRCHDPKLGLAVWAAVHGLAMLVLENVIDLGQRRSGLHVLPSRAEILSAQACFRPSAIERLARQCEAASPLPARNR